MDDNASENLAVDAHWSVTHSRAAWTGVVPADSVVFLRAFDSNGLSLLRPVRLGKFVGSRHWYSDHAADGWADFDARTSIARLGMGSRSMGASLLGTVIANPVPRWTIQAVRRGSFLPQNVNSLFGLRIDYGSTHGGFRKSVLWHDGSYCPARTALLPWGEKTARADQTHLEKALATGAAFQLNIASEAPPDWDRRIILTPILQNMPAHSQARFIFTPAR